ncbi:MAG: exonuclease, partial [Candidatus Latescibacteria bacterium]|nr:exonuclease [bacterium]MBD3423917.1 exonuclease [Candidatus Latescibacterota bacterium]
GMVVDQLFARDYSEEKTVLEFSLDFLGRFSALVTFNGRCFDIPYIIDRMTVWRIGGLNLENHLDLLPLSRKMVRGSTPNHKLQTLERHLLGMKRVDDTPGHRIPEIYHDFVRTGDAAGIAGIIEHNRLDLVSMLRLVTLYLSGPLT